MVDLHRVHDRLNREGRLGPAARLGATNKARTLRGPGAGLVIDGPFAETKEQLLGFYVVDYANEEAAIEAARELRRVNPERGLRNPPPRALSSRRRFSDHGRAAWRDWDRRRMNLRGEGFRMPRTQRALDSARLVLAKTKLLQ